MADHVIIAGAGMGGLAASVALAEQGIKAIVIEKGDRVGGAASFSGGQVWVGGNHVEARDGFQDSIEEALDYVTRIADNKKPGTIDKALARRWTEEAVKAARYFEGIGAIRWEVIPEYPDYYYPDVASGRKIGRYLTGAPLSGKSLGAARETLHVGPYFLTGITYREIFDWGGVSSRTKWDWDLVKQRREEDMLTYGPGVVAWFYKAALDRGVEFRLNTAAKRLIEQDGKIVGLEVEGRDGKTETLYGTVVLATGAHDWSRELSDRFTGIGVDNGGSITPPTITGDAIAMAEAVGADLASIPPWAAPVLPGYQGDDRAYPGDQGFRNCMETGLPHAFMVNRAGKRFCDDSFHSDVVAAALKEDADGSRPNLPIFLIWDENHHEKYGLGKTLPGQPYPEGLVTSATSLRELGEKLGIDGVALEATAAHFNIGARDGKDPDFDRGNNLSVQVFRGDWTHKPHPNIGQVEKAPFHGMRLRLLNTGIASAGIRGDGEARALRKDGSVIEGLYAVGECATRATAGVGYNSGYSLGRAMTFGYIAANHIASGAGRSVLRKTA
jgi:3-oxosteroid 1-dehydrogenase